MAEAKIGRVLLASLHQAIGEVLPTELEFYESWLNPNRLREKEFGRAPFNAVFSFLRRQPDRYSAVVRLAGQYTADWTVASFSSSRRTLIRALPVALRVRVVVWLAGRTLRQLYDATRIRVRSGPAAIYIDVRESLFCDVRDRAASPLCEFYAAALGRFLERFELSAQAAVVHCRAQGHQECRVALQVRSGSLASVD